MQFFDNIEDMPKRSFWYHSEWQQDEPLGYVVFTFPHVTGTLWLWCVHIVQLMTHPSDYTLAFTLQLCYKPLRALQRVAKSLKIHFSSYDESQNFATSSLLNKGPRVPQSGDGYCLTAVHSPHKPLQETSITYQSFFDIHFNCTD